MAHPVSVTFAIEAAVSADRAKLADWADWAGPGGLIEQLDAELRAVYPAASLHPVDLAGFAAAGGVFVVGRVHGEAAACGAIRPLDAETAELKRVFVAPAHRRKGIARALMLQLEQTARERGFQRLRLETGAGNPEALKLYEAIGYQPIPAFGEYIHDPLSLCYEKRL